MPESSKDDNNINPILETDNFAVLLDDDSSSPGEYDSELEADLLADEVLLDEELDAESTELLEDDLLNTDELTIEELVDADVKDNHFETLLDDDSITSGKYDSELEADLLVDEVLLDEELDAESESTELPEYYLQNTNEPLDELTFEELVDADVKDDHFETLLDDDSITSGKYDSELDAESESTELPEYYLLNTNESDDKLTFEELVDADVKDDHFETLLDDDSITSGKYDSELDAESESTELPEYYLLNTNESDDKLTFEELVDADVKDDHFETLLDDDFVAPGKYDSEPEADLLVDEVLLDEELDAESTGLLEDELLITNEPAEELTFEELVDADVKDDDFLAPEKYDFEPEADLLVDEVPMDEELGAEIPELLGDDFLVTNEPVDELTVDALIEMDSATDNPVGESGFDFMSDTDLFSDKDETAQAVFAANNASIANSEVRHSDAVEKIDDKVAPSHAAKHGVLRQPHENQLHKSNDGLPSFAEREKPAASIVQDILASAAENRRYTDKQFQKSFIVLAILVVFGGGAGIWYGYNSIGNGTQPFEQGQDGQGYQPETVLQEAVKPVKTQLNTLKKQLDTKTRKNSSELLDMSMATRELERRLATVEKNIVDDGGKDQTPQIVELGQQLKHLQQLVQEPVKTNQEVTEENTLQLDRLDTSIKQLENRVSLIRRQQNSMDNSLVSVERGISGVTTSVAAIQSDAITKEAQKETINRLKEQLDTNTEKNSSELLNMSRATRELERRLASVEKDLVDDGTKDQTDQIVKLGQQLELLEQMVQEPSEPNQEVTEEITLQLDRLDTSIKQLENRVSLIRRQQNSMDNSLVSVERGISGVTTSVAAIQSDAITKEAQKETINRLKEQLDTNTEKNSSELLNMSRATRELERRLASVEKDLVDDGTKDQTDQIVKLGQQLELLEQMVQEPSEPNQEVTEEITLQFDRLDTSIKQLEDRVSRIRRQQDSMGNSLSSVERGISGITTSVAAMRSDDPLKDTRKETESVHSTPSISEDIPVPERRSETDNITSVNMSNVQKTPSSSDKIIPAKGVVAEQVNWVVNLASFKKRALAEKEQKRFNALGLESIIHQAQVMETTWYRVRIEGFSSAVTARKYMKILQSECDGIKDAWVSSRQF